MSVVSNNLVSDSASAQPVFQHGGVPSSVVQNSGAIAENALKPNIQGVSLSWDERLISKIDHFENTTIAKIPNLLNTQFLDGVAIRATNFLNKITLELAPIKILNDWLNEDEFKKENWNNSLDKIAVFLAKLPLRCARNILNMVLNIIKMALYVSVYTVVHPAKAAMKLAKMLIRLLKELTKPETWTKMGAGIIGVSLGQAAMGNIFAPFALILGGAMMCGGLLGGVIVAVATNKNNKLKAIEKELVKQIKKIPESMLTGFLMGLIFAPAQKHWNNLKESRNNQLDYYKQYDNSWNGWWKREWAREEIIKLNNFYAAYPLPPQFVVQNGALIASSMRESIK